MKKTMSMIVVFITLMALPAWGFAISGHTRETSETTSAPHVKKVNISVSKIEDGYIYDRAGNKYRIHPHTRIIDHRQQGKHKVTIGELVFEDGILKYVVLKGGK